MEPSNLLLPQSTHLISLQSISSSNSQTVTMEQRFMTLFSLLSIRYPISLFSSQERNPELSWNRPMCYSRVSPSIGDSQKASSQIGEVFLCRNYEGTYSTNWESHCSSSLPTTYKQMDNLKPPTNIFKQFSDSLSMSVRMIGLSTLRKSNLSSII